MLFTICSITSIISYGFSLACVQGVYELSSSNTHFSKAFYQMPIYYGLKQLKSIAVPAGQNLGYLADNRRDDIFSVWAFSPSSFYNRHMPLTKYKLPLLMSYVNKHKNRSLLIRQGKHCTAFR